MVQVWPVGSLLPCVRGSKVRMRGNGPQADAYSAAFTVTGRIARDTRVSVRL